MAAQLETKKAQLETKDAQLETMDAQLKTVMMEKNLADAVRELAVARRASDLRVATTNVRALLECCADELAVDMGLRGHSRTEVLSALFSGAKCAGFAHFLCAAARDNGVALEQVKRSGAGMYDVLSRFVHSPSVTTASGVVLSAEEFYLPTALLVEQKASIVALAALARFTGRNAVLYSGGEAAMDIVLRAPPCSESRCASTAADIAAGPPLKLK